MIGAEILPDVPGLGRGTVLVLAGMSAVLVVGTAVRLGRRAVHPGDTHARDRLHSVGTWWVLFAAFAGALVLGPAAVLAGMVLASLLLLRETLRLEGPERDARATAWAVLLATAGPGFTAATAYLPAHASRPDAGMGWLVLLALLTELNDSAQAWWGRALGRRPLAPRLSPKKTWEGLAGGVATTAAASLLVAPILTPWGHAVPWEGGAPGPPWLYSGSLGLLLALGGTAGDLLASSRKRRAGVKDSGTMLPGHGGLLDRLDSLTVTAPLFYLLSRLLWI